MLSSIKLDLMSHTLNFLIPTQDRDHIHKTIPPVFRPYFQKLTNIFDCFEIFIEQPKNLKARAQVYNNCKKHSTVKYLISSSPIGAVTFLSPGCGGCAADIQIFQESGFISLLPGGSATSRPWICIGRGFDCWVQLWIFHTSIYKRLTAKEVEKTRQIATVRIHLERIIGEIKIRFRILDGSKNH